MTWKLRLGAALTVLAVAVSDGHTQSRPPTWNLFATNADEKPLDPRPPASVPQAAPPASVPQAAPPRQAPRVQDEAPLPPAALRPSQDDAHRPSLRGMIGQMLLVGFPGSARDSTWTRRIADWNRSGKIGGVVLFSTNVVSPAQVTRLTAELAPSGTGVKPFVCVDQEGGAIQRLTPDKGFVGLPAAQDISEMDRNTATRFYRESANELARLGINCNFGPVVDLNINPRNPAIGKLGRSYGRDPKQVMTFAGAFLDAHRQAGILTAAKHFPGHGSARNDPHDEVVDITNVWQEIELEPFRTIGANDAADMVMVGHLIHPKFSDGSKPASLSRKAIEGVLRGQLGYRGLVVSDDLDMGAIRRRYGIDEAAVLAIEAGSDLVIIANIKDPDPLIADRIGEAVEKAVRDGRLSVARIEESWRRIMRAKTFAGRRAYVQQ